MKQIEAATAILEERQPERVITFGGDCLVSQAPFAYLAKRYGERLGVLWIDALLYFLLNQRVHHFATFLHSFAIVVSLEAPGGEVKPGMLQSTLATP